MKLRKVISGGQTGADRTGLECAKKLGLETGGWAPRHYKTETGYDISLKSFGLKQTKSEHYSARTLRNVEDSDVTIWFGNLGSPGYYCTFNSARIMGKKFIINPESLIEIADTYEVINIAGNRKSTNPKVVDLVKTAFKTLEEK